MDRCGVASLLGCFCDQPENHGGDHQCGNCGLRWSFRADGTPFCTGLPAGPLSLPYYVDCRTIYLDEARLVFQRYFWQEGIREEIIETLVDQSVAKVRNGWSFVLNPGNIVWRKNA